MIKKMKKSEKELEMQVKMVKVRVMG